MIRLRPALSVLPAAAALWLAACAEGAPDAAPAPAPSPRTGAQAAAPRCPPLFVSPAGEPFRADPDAAGGVCPLRAWFAKADADGDGALTRTEFRNDALRFFAMLDTNGDGAIDAYELQHYEHSIAPEILGRGGGGPRATLEGAPRLILAALQPGGGIGGGMGGGGGGRGGGRGRGDDGPSQTRDPKAQLEGGAGLSRFGLLAEPEPVAAADLNFDGRITRAEFTTRADQRFVSLDEAEANRLTLPDLERRMRLRAGEHPRSGSGDSPRSGGGGRGSGGGHGRGGGGGFTGGPQS